MDEVQVVVLARGMDDPALVERAYHDVLWPSFTADELPPLGQFVDEVAGSTVMVAERGGEPVAAAISDVGESSSLGLLSHLAVRSDQRGTGVGALMMDRLKTLWRQCPEPLVLGEVHDPRCWPDTPQERPLDRLRFYERSGARLLMVPWVQPRLWEGGERVGGMCLLVMGGRETSDHVAADAVRQWMVGYYEVAEGVGVDDPDLAALLERVGEVDPIPIRPVDCREEMPVLDRSVG